jgi:beta-phosphoglucomutase-like phosphatase (HAD superfamily)
MQAIEGILIEPVGCLAEFPPGPFQWYWNLLQSMGESSFSPSVEALEIEAVNAASIYADAVPALRELRAMGVHLSIASSLSEAAIARFLEKHCLGEFFAAVWNRDNAGGVRAVPLVRAVQCASLQPQNVMFLTDTAEGIKIARSAGVHPVLMMNDPDEARRLAMHNPAGGVVSLHEISDFIRLIAAQNSRGPR